MISISQLIHKSTLFDIYSLNYCFPHRNYLQNCIPISQREKQRKNNNKNNAFRLLSMYIENVTNSHRNVIRSCLKNSCVHYLNQYGRLKCVEINSSGTFFSAICFSVSSVPFPNARNAVEIL